MPRYSPICVDANLVVRLVAYRADEIVARLWQQWRNDSRTLVAPTLMTYEVTNAVHRLAEAAMATSAEVGQALTAALDLPIELHDGVALHHSALDLARRFSLPAAYDAHYLALAERLGAEFWTADQRLANSVRPQLSWVYLIGE